MGFMASAGTSILSPGRAQLMAEFDVSSTVAILPVALYVFALGFGPVIGGPLSETVGRLPIYALTMPLGSLFALGAGLTHSFGVLCFCRFMSGFCWSPVLAVPSASISETFPPKTRGPASAVFILMPFLGPGLGPVMGSFLVSRKGWRWTQWTLILMAVFCMLQLPFLRETFNPIVKRRLAKTRGLQLPPKAPPGARLSQFARVAVIRPVHMLFAEPIVTFLCLYVAVNFGILFSFFAGVPYTFGLVYRFSLESSGLVFLSIATGCVAGFLTIILCDVFIYRRKLASYPHLKTPPEHRLYPAMIGSLGLPVGLFWYGWTARASVGWASPAVAIFPFAWGNLCVFVSSIQYMSDTYQGNVIASAVSANGLARYGFAGAFPLFTIQMYEGLGIDWACSLLGFFALALLPIPWVLFRYGPKIRAKSKYDTVDYTYE
ncbi:Major facilitator superfamily domain, general substrate transporter [Metarhizium album ARSEF 1941]|uniref:Major facilitator superfamily domain, general substrate transporter n=1 Tax=Metarhizium album (strain ARSEF 1941) TaxID=1081103 RepID=A0A0B2WUQ8_METAS|nr:Major facilitator superfamily domain, general substrate transporter [Metarhizium album ARSEF 1941]KHN96690.1 Major facilitator superfamily domain, general substrate transporter [Metarhizium album ARSEF 1941]